MKSYMNHAITGDGKMLGCFSEKGELIRLFWPELDRFQWIDHFYVGIFSPQFGATTSWLHEDPWRISHQYVEDTNILKLRYRHPVWNLVVTLNAYTLPTQDIFVCDFEITYQGDDKPEINLVCYSKTESNQSDPMSTLYAHEEGMLIHYRPDLYYAILGQKRPDGFQITDGALTASQTYEFNGVNDIGMIGEGTLGWNLGKLSKEKCVNFSFYLLFQNHLGKCYEAAKKVLYSKDKNFYEQTKNYWGEFLNRGKLIESKHEGLDAAYRRSLLVFALMCDRHSGGIIAAPEVDEGFTTCGRYGYCWGRDAGFITTALDAAGYHEEVDRFYHWAEIAQLPDGSWQQRYHLDGQLAPSWGIQIDETGTLLWGAWEHYKATNNKEFLIRHWKMIEKGLNFLLSFFDDNGLPNPTYDLWEERRGQHLYSAVAVWAGLQAGLDIAKEIGETLTYSIEKVEAFKEKILLTYSSSHFGRFVRAVNAEVKGEGFGGWHEMVVNPSGAKKWVTDVDATVDICLAGLVTPFHFITPRHTMMEKTLKAIKQNLTDYHVGGFYRYQWDDYRGGNPWILATLWFALVEIEKGKRDVAEQWLMWCLKHQNELGLLPEQVDREKGGPAWVVPLTWSHAMYVLVYEKLYKK